ncbi:MAG: DUF2062 domain-containing protein [Synechococcaceae cyanobacterium]|nr:DUF2062 domain-containing protein [Synechococcaceae cyanobacterium]
MPVFRLPFRRPQPTPRRLIRRWRLQLLRLWRQDGSHGHRARGLAAGIFTGCYPFFGLQIVLGVGLAALLRGSPILAAAGTWISNPVTSLPLYWFNYQVGCLLLGAGPAFPSLQQVQEGALWDLGLAFSSRLMLGSTVVGLVSALALGGGFWWWAHRQPSRSERDPGRARSTQRSL